jgi:hypothetical protein
MSKLVAIAITAAVCLPLGALLQGKAAADRRVNGPGADHIFFIKGQPHLATARIALHAALDEINASQDAKEGIWEDLQQRGPDAKERIERAVQSVDRATDWSGPGLSPGFRKGEAMRQLVSHSPFCSTR